MDSRKYLVILIALVCIAIFAAGCTSSKPVTVTPTPAATATPGAAMVTTAVPVVSTTLQCPDKNVWDGKWGTKWNSYENGDTIVDLYSGADNWDGYVTTPVTMTQNCWDVTGTIAFQPDCIGTITSGTIDKNHPNLLTGGWETTGCQPEDEGAVGTLSVSMAADNKTWIGKLISVNDPYKDRDYQPNWAGRK
jgi:hypothetical protein